MKAGRSLAVLKTANSRTVFLVDRDDLSRIAIENNLRKKSFDMVSTRSINDAVRYVRESNEIGLLLVGLESTTVSDVYAAVKKSSELRMFRCSL